MRPMWPRFRKSGTQRYRKACPPGFSEVWYTTLRRGPPTGNFASSVHNVIERPGRPGPAAPGRGIFILPLFFNSPLLLLFWSGRPEIPPPYPPWGPPLTEIPPPLILPPRIRPPRTLPPGFVSPRIRLPPHSSPQILQIGVTFHPNHPHHHPKRKPCSR